MKCDRRMPFLSLNQQCQSTENYQVKPGKCRDVYISPDVDVASVLTLGS